jgi:butyryl-CoA dehydrogenase
LDLLGRKVFRGDGIALKTLVADIERVIARASAAGVDEVLGARLHAATHTVLDTTTALMTQAGSDPAAALLHSADYLDMMCTWVVGYLWLEQACVAREKLTQPGADTDFMGGKLLAASYFINSEVPRVTLLAELCRSGEDSYGRARSDNF